MFLFKTPDEFNEYQRIKDGFIKQNDYIIYMDRDTNTVSYHDLTVYQYEDEADAPDHTPLYTAEQFNEVISGKFKKQHGRALTKAIKNGLAYRSDDELLDDYRQLIHRYYYDVLTDLNRERYYYADPTDFDSELIPIPPTPLTADNFDERRIESISNFITYHPMYRTKLLIVQLHNQVLTERDIKGIDEVNALYADYLAARLRMADTLKYKDYIEYRLDERSYKEHQDANAVRKVLRPLTKLSDNLDKISEPGKPLVIDVASDYEKKHGKEVKEYLVPAFDVDAIGQNPIDKYSIELNIAAMNLWAAGNYFITPDQVVSLITQKKANRKQADEAWELLNKQRRIDTRFDFTEALRDQEATVDGEKLASARVNQQLFFAREVELVTENGRVIRGWELPKNIKPLIYVHMMATGQYYTHSARLLKSAAEAGSSTHNNVLIRSYLIKRIAQLKNSTKRQKDVKYYRIVIDSIFKAQNIEVPSRAQRQRYVDYVLKLLEVFTEDEFILEYEEIYNEGRSKTLRAVDITVN